MGVLLEKIVGWGDRMGSWVRGQTSGQMSGQMRGCVAASRE